MPLGSRFEAILFSVFSLPFGTKPFSRLELGAFTKAVGATPLTALPIGLEYTLCSIPGSLRFTLALTPTFEAFTADL